MALSRLLLPLVSLSPGTSHLPETWDGRLAGKSRSPNLSWPW